MIEDVFVFDATTHSFNLDESNVQDNRWAKALWDAFLEWHEVYSPPSATLASDLYMRNWPAESLAEVLFLESQTDMGGTHNLRLDSFFKDGLVDLEDVIEISKRWPNRFVTYLGVDPTEGPSCLEDLKRQHELLPEAVGLKLYPAQANPYRSFRADDPEVSLPLFQLAGELGIKTIAFHKSLAVLGIPSESFHVGDIEGAACEFPDLNFEIVHAGAAFLEESAQVIARFDNVFANLEITSLLAVTRPVLFDEIMATLLYWGGPDKLLYSTGAMEFHPQPILEAVWNYKVSDRFLERFAMEQLSREDREKIMGRNYAGIVGVDIVEAAAKIAGDEFDKQRDANGGLRPAYSYWKERMGVDPDSVSLPDVAKDHSAMGMAAAPAV
jgi:predicted TIM-barrel fold metal-dependent hydrolase